MLTTNSILLKYYNLIKLNCKFILTNKSINFKNFSFNYFIILSIIVSSFACNPKKQSTKQISKLDSKKEEIIITDVENRTVKVKIPIERIALSESMYLYLIASFNKENPIKKIVAWNNNLKKSSILSYNQYKEKFPEIEDITNIESKDKLIDIKKLIAKKPDIVIFSLTQKTKIDKFKYIEKLEKAKIPAIFIDVKKSPIKNTNKSIKLLGKLFKKEDIAEKIINFRNNAISKITNTLKEQNPQKPKVLIEYKADKCCKNCKTFINGNFGHFIKLAGGINSSGNNIAPQYLKDNAGNLNLRQIIVPNPNKIEVIIMIATKWSKSFPQGTWIPLGPGTNMEKTKNRIHWLYKNNAYKNSKAVKNSKIYALWHQFYNSPYEFIAIQKMAKWFHPELFEDLDPDETFKEYHDNFLPIDYKYGYWSK